MISAYDLAISSTENVIQKGDFNQQGATVTIKQAKNPLNLQWLVAYSFTQNEPLEV